MAIGEAAAASGPAGAWRRLRSVIFTGTIFTAMAALAVVFTPWAAVSREGARQGIRTWCRLVLWLARPMLGLASEIRGPVPEGEVLVAAKHQSFLDIILLCSVLPRPKFVMKKELVRAPILGWYALRIGCVPVDRGKRARAVEKMLADVAAGRDAPGQVVIYPQGTRVPPGLRAPYKAGAGALYAALGQPCVPAATNAGLFWARGGMARGPGRAVLVFLPPLPAGMQTARFMAELEARVETASDVLLNEAEGRGGG